jgi:hypothetical protein
VTPLNDGDAVTVECGPQGGHHLWVALAMTNLSQVGTITTLSATQPGTALSVPATAYPYAWAPGDAAACDLVGVRFQIDLGGTNIADFLGKPLDITVEAQDKSGRKASATKRVNVSSERHGDFCMPLGGPSVP